VRIHLFEKDPANSTRKPSDEPHHDIRFPEKA